MRIQDKGNKFGIVDNDTDYLKVHELDYDPAHVHIKERQMEQANNSNDRGMTKVWKDYLINNESKPGKNVR